MSKKPEGPGKMMVGGLLTVGSILDYLKAQTSYERTTLLRELRILKDLKALEASDIAMPQVIKNSIVRAKHDAQKAIIEWEGYLAESIATMLPKYFVNLIVDELTKEARRAKLVKPSDIKNLTFT